MIFAVRERKMRIIKTRLKYKTIVRDLLQKIKRMKDDFEQLEKGYILMLRLKDEEISRLKGMISEPSEEQVKKYCRKRNLVLITKEMYCHLQYRWANNHDVGVLSAEQNWNGDPIKR